MDDLDLPEQEEPSHDVEEMNALIHDLNHLNQLKLQKADLEAQIEDFTSATTKEMNALRMKEFGFVDDLGNPVKATMVTGTTRNVDLEYLKEIDRSLAEAICDFKVNTAKLKKAESLGLFSQPKFNAVFSERPKRPYILFSSPEETSNE